MTEAALVVAQEHEASALLAAGGPLADTANWAYAALGPITMLEVAELVGLALGLDARAIEALGADAEVLACGTLQEGPWVVRLPPGFAPALARRDDAALDALAERWMASDELADLTPAAVLRNVRAAAALCRQLARPAVPLLWVRL